LETFKLFPLPKTWALDGVQVSESMLAEIPQYIENSSLAVTIKPGEELLLSIGSLYPRPAKTRGVLPRTLFVQKDALIFPECENVLTQDLSKDQKTSLNLKVVTGDQCMIIPCGWVSYIE